LKFGQLSLAISYRSLNIEGIILAFMGMELHLDLTNEIALIIWYPSNRFQEILYILDNDEIAEIEIESMN